MGNEQDVIRQLQLRIELLERYLSQFDSWRQFISPGSPDLPKPKKTGKGCRLPETWQPDESLLLWARKEFPLVNLVLETDKFVDYWLSRSDKGAIKLSWERTWRNWIRQASHSYRRNHETNQRPDKLDILGAIRNSFE